MTRPTILVTCNIEGALICQFRDRDRAVRALVQAPYERSERLRKLGAELVVADLFDPDRVRQAIQRTHRACYCPPVHPCMIQGVAALAARTESTRYRRDVWVIAGHRPSIQFGRTTQEKLR